MSDFCKRFSGAYDSCRRHNWISQIREIIPQNVRPKRKSREWPFELLMKEALKYTRKTDFKAHSYSAYNYARNNNLLDKVCSHMPSIHVVRYNLEHIKSEAEKYQTIRDFRKKSPKVYLAAKRNNLLDDVCIHMTKGSYIYWTKERCQARAILYQSKKEFKLNDGSAYTTSVREGWLSEICQHMTTPIPKRKWTYDKLKETAMLYATKNEFKKNAPSAYTTAVREKLINDICSHMTIIAMFHVIHSIVFFGLSHCSI